LAYLISKSGASKGIIVTTTKLTKRALQLMSENQAIMAYIDNEMSETEFRCSKEDWGKCNMP